MLMLFIGNHVRVVMVLLVVAS